MAAEVLDGFELAEDHFVELLGKLVGESKYLQNNPPECVPVEDRGALPPSSRDAMLRPRPATAADICISPPAPRSRA